MHLVFPWVPFGMKKSYFWPNADVRFTIRHVLLRLYNTCAAVRGVLLTITVVRELYVVLGIVRCYVFLISLCRLPSQNTTGPIKTVPV